MGLGMMTIDDPPALKEVGTVLDNGTKIEAEQTMPQNTLIFRIVALKWLAAQDAEAGHAA